MQSWKRLPALHTRSILKCIQSIKSDAPIKEKEWLKRHSELIKEMHKSHEKLIKQDTSNTLKLRTDWKHLNTRIFQAEMGICHKFQLMQTLSLNVDSPYKTFELEHLRNGILDINSGVLSNLSIIHQVLVGKTVTNPTEKGLLEMWSKGIYDYMMINPMSAKKYRDYVDIYLDKAAILQFRGILLYAEASTASSVCLHQFDLFENNLTSQIKTMAKTVPEYLKYLIDPDEKDVFVLRPVFKSELEPFVRSQGLNKRISYDYMCGNTEEGKWILKKSNTFVDDGSLLISGSSKDGKCYYMSVSEKNVITCVSEECYATTFFVIPEGFTNNKMKISICKAKFKDKPFLGNSLRFVDGNGEREFTLSFDCI